MKYLFTEFIISDTLYCPYSCLQLHYILINVCILLKKAKCLVVQVTCIVTNQI